MLQNDLQEQEVQKYTTTSNGVSPLVAGLAGVIAGAAGITALILADKDIRKKVRIRAIEAKIVLQKWSATKLQEEGKKATKASDKLEDDAINDELTPYKEKIHN